MEDEEQKRTKADNNKIVIWSLAGIAITCCVISAGVLFFDGEGAKDILALIFQPVMMTTAGLLGFLKS